MFKIDNNLHSITDVLKKTLFFFEQMSVGEMISHVQKNMYEHLGREQVEDKVRRCLKQNKCFIQKGKEQWAIHLEGERKNDSFYNYLLKRQRPIQVKEMVKGRVKSKKKGKTLVSEEAGLIIDGRFIHLSNGYWGLTEWEVETAKFSLKQMVIKVLKTHPGGLSVQQLYELIQQWKDTTGKAIEGVLEKFPFFNQTGNGIWVYEPAIHIAYESLSQKFVVSLNRQRKRWSRDKEERNSKRVNIEKQLKEIELAYQETAAALALKMEESGKQEQIMTQMAEKDLLLSLRKKEIFRYREHIEKLEKKSNSILYQCRLWVKRAKEAEEKNQQLHLVLQKNLTNLEAMFTKLQHYKEKDRENKTYIIELKDKHATKVAELQTEIVEFKNKLDRTLEMAVYEEKKYKEEINMLEKDLNEMKEERDDLQRDLRFIQQEVNKFREERKSMENKIKNPLVQMTMRICSWFGGDKKYKAS